MGIILFFTVVVLLGAIVLIVYLAFTKGEPAPSSWLVQYFYAHRGLHDSESPENSMPAFEKAAEQGYGVELDVHLSRDGLPVVFHDDNIKRMTGIDKKISELSAAELAAVSLAGSGEGIQLFSDVLRTIDGRVPILIEFKNTGRAGELEERTWELLKGYTGKFAVQSFSPFSVQWFKNHAPDVPRGQLSSRFEEFRGSMPAYQIYGLKNLLSNVFARPNFISYDINSLPKGVVTRLRKKGIFIFGWTVRTEEERERAREYCDTIIFEHIRP